MDHRDLRRASAALLVFGLSVALSAPAGAAEPVPPEKWAKKVCGAVAEWLGAIGEAAAAAPASSSDLLVASNQLDMLLTDARAATKALVKSVKEAGLPDLPKGAKIAKVYRKAYGDLAAALGDARNDLRSVPRGAPDAPVDAFPKAVAAARTAFEAALDDTQAAIDRADVLASKRLTATLRREPSCVAITG